ncbi:MAG: DUF1684 domain-containing protein [Vicinamibacterales bacterium]
MSRILAAILLSLLPVGAGPGRAPALGTLEEQASYRAEIAAWRATREKQLLSDQGWFTVVGLFWLKEGRNSFGADPANDIVLPAGAAPLRAGSFVLEKGSISVEFGANAEGTVNGKSVGSAVLASDVSGTPDVVSVGAGRLNMTIIKRGERIGVRLRDRQASARLEAARTGLRYFPVDPAWRVEAQFVRDPQTVEIVNVLGQLQLYSSPGHVRFEVAGREVRLYPVLESEDASELFFIFRDETSGRETYGGGRFLYTELPGDGRVILDFNKAENPPCAYTDFATCPLPPARNRVRARVEAGEMTYRKH